MVPTLLALHPQAALGRVVDLAVAAVGVAAHLVTWELAETTEEDALLQTASRVSGVQKCIREGRRGTLLGIDLRGDVFLESVERDLTYAFWAYDIMSLVSTLPNKVGRQTSGAAKTTWRAFSSQWLRGELGCRFSFAA